MIRMQKNNMKNIVVLKNLPSNIVDEAIVILKANKNAKKFQYVESNTSVDFEESRKSSDYVIREAEAVIANYISKIENNKKMRYKNRDFNRKYNRLKKYSICISIFFLFCIIKILISN
jgi:hypothetical protein